MNWLDAEEAAARMGITKPTLYAYVSRGFIESRPLKDSRKCLYSEGDVDACVRRKQQRHDPGAVAKTALDWGVPVMDSAITWVSEGKLYYRGQDATQLAVTSSVEAVAGLLWDGVLRPMEISVPQEPSVVTSPALDLAARLLQACPQLEAMNPDAWRFKPDAIGQIGAHMLGEFVAVIAPGSAPTVAARICESWGLPVEAERLISAALILCADHELNVSAFATRCAASAGATPYGAVAAGISAARGRRHAGIVDRVDAFIGEVNRRGFERAWMARKRRGEDIPGFDHPLYPQGDPRASALKKLLEENDVRSPYQDVFSDAYNSKPTHEDLLPSVDFSLAILGRVFDLEIDQVVSIFVLGRTIGWLAHVSEQYQDNTLIRPRANYVGPMPR